MSDINENPPEVFSDRRPKLKNDFGGEQILDLKESSNNEKSNQIAKKVMEYDEKLLELCRANLFFIREGSLYDPLELEELGISGIRELQDTIQAKFESIKKLKVTFPVLNSELAKSVTADIEFIKAICSSLEDNTYIGSSNNLTMTNKRLVQEYSVLAEFATKRMEILELSLAAYNHALKKLTKKRPTRSTAAIVDGREPLSLSLFYTLNTFDTSMGPCPKLILTEQDEQLEEYEDSAASSLNEDVLLEQSKDLSDGVNQGEVHSKSINNTEINQFINEQYPHVLFEENDYHGKLQVDRNKDDDDDEVISICSNATPINQHKNDVNSDIVLAKKINNTLVKKKLLLLLQELLGDYHEPEEIQDLDIGIGMICERYGVSLSANDPDILKTLENINRSQKMLEQMVLNTSDSDRNAERSEFSENVFTNNPRHQSTPLYSMNRLIQNPTQNEEIPFSIYYDPTDTGLSSNHSKKATVRFLEQYENAQTTEVKDQLQNIGEQLYPLVYELQPRLAKKITGMMLEMPKECLDDIIESDSLLKSFVAKAVNILAESNYIEINRPKTDHKQAPSAVLQKSFDHQNLIFQEVTSSGQSYMSNLPGYSNPRMTISGDPTSYQPLMHSSYPASICTSNSFPRQYVQPSVSQNLYYQPAVSYSASGFTMPETYGHNPSGYSQYPTGNQYGNMLNYGNAPLKNTIIPTYWSSQQHLTSHVPQTQHVRTPIMYPNLTNPYRRDYEPTLVPPTNGSYHPSIPNAEDINLTPSKKPKQTEFTTNNLTESKGETPAIVELAQREARELASSCFLVERTINQLSHAANMDSQELMDLLSNMNFHIKSMEKLEQKVSSFLKYLINNKATIESYDATLYISMRKEVGNAEQLSILLQRKLNEADSIIKAERITTSQLSHAESKQLPYKEFNGSKGLQEPHIWEFFNILDTNFKIARTAENIKAQVLKKLLKGSARLAIPEDLNDYTQIKQILISRFGNPVIILSDILELHKNIGKIPSKYCQRPPWHKIEDAAKNHLMLIRKAEQLAKNRMAVPEIFASGHRNFNLLMLISHEYNEDLLAMMPHTDERTMYSHIVARFEQILASASSNLDHSDKALKKDANEKKQPPVLETDQFALAYGEKKPNAIMVGTCQPDECHICSILQKTGMGSNYFENHLLHGASKRNYVNNCPNYLHLDIEEKNSLINDHKLCKYCLKYKSECKNSECGNSHLLPHPSGKAKAYVCKSSTCKNRVELCLEHVDMNKETVEQRKQNLMKKIPPDVTIGAFTSVATPLLFNIDTFNGKIKTTVINDNRLRPTDNDIIDVEDTISNSSKVKNWLNNIYPNQEKSNSQTDTTSRNDLTKVHNIQEEYEMFKKEKIINPDDPILYSHAQNGNGTFKDDFDQEQPLMVESTEDLLQMTNASLLATNSKSIFIYSKIKGALRPLSVLFDSGGGSSLVLNSIPGRQLYATKKDKKPVILQGIGSGQALGSEYKMALPLRTGKSVAVDIYGVSEILKPMSKIDLNPALKFLKDSVSSDETINESLKNEIARASVYRFIEGNLDMLLGIKLLRVFPELLHTLSCGLSIFKMRLKPASESTLYCLGGPWRYLENIKDLFPWPNAAIMLQSLDMELNNWRPSSLADFYVMTSKTSAKEEDKANNISNDNTILAVPEPPEFEQRQWAKFIYKTLQEFNIHLEEYHTKSNKLSSPKKTIDDNGFALRKAFGKIYKYYFMQYQITKDIAVVKNAIEHLMHCSYIHQNESKCKKPNAYIALECDQNFVHDLSTFQSFFSGYYPHLKSSLISPVNAHLCLLGIHIHNNKQLQKAAIALNVALNKWLDMVEVNYNMIHISFKGVESFSNQIFYIKPSVGNDKLTSLQQILLSTFTDKGIKCDTILKPHIAFAKLHYPIPEVTAMMYSFSDIVVGGSSFGLIKMLKSNQNDLPDANKCLKALPFYQDATLIKNQSETPCEDMAYFRDESPIIENMQLKSFVSSKEKMLYHKLSEIHEWKEIASTAQTIEPVDMQLTQREIMLFQEANTKEEISDKQEKGNQTYHQISKKGYNFFIQDLKSILQEQIPYPKCNSCLNCDQCKALWLRCNSNVASTEHYEETQIRNSITYDPIKEKFSAPLPLKSDPESCLAPNDNHAKHMYYKMAKSLNNNQDEKNVILNSFNKLIDLGYVKKLSDMDNATQADVLSKQCYFIPWQVVYKLSSVTTPCRIVLNASSITKSGKSLNNLLCKGAPKLNMLPLTLAMLIDPILVTLDLSKFYNSVLIPKSQYHLQCVFWNENLDPDNPPEIFILTTHFYGLASSGRILEMCLEKTAELHKDKELFHRVFTTQVYVDDIFANCQTSAEADQIKHDCNTILPKMGFKIKGFGESYKEPDNSISEIIDGEKSVPTLGMIWFPKSDHLRYRIPNFDLSIKQKKGQTSTKPFTGESLEEFQNYIPQKITLRSVASKAASLYDPIGYLQPWYLGVKHLLRLSCESVGRDWDAYLSDDLRNQWTKKFYEMLQLKSVNFNRCTFPKNLIYHDITLVGISDFGGIGAIQAFYALRKIDNSEFHVQLVYAKSQIRGKKSVPCEELNSLHACSQTMSKICMALHNVTRKVLLMDSVVCGFWLMKTDVKLAPFQRIRVHNILSHNTQDEIFHIRSSLNSSDIGTKRPEPINCILPGSRFHQGPHYLTLGIDECEKKGLIRNIKHVVLDPKLKPLALDGITFKNKETEMELKIKENLNDQVSSDEITNYCTDTVVAPIKEPFTDKVLQRFIFNDYLINPITKPWSKCITVLSIVIHFIRKTAFKSALRCAQLRPKDPKNSRKKVTQYPLKLPVELKDSSNYLCHFCISSESEEAQYQILSTIHKDKLTLSYASLFDSPVELAHARQYAVFYFMTLASKELKHFYTPSMLKKHTICKNGIYFSRQRVLEASHVSDVMDNSVNIQELGINQRVPCADRYSPVAISVLMHYHRKVCNHMGVDRTWLKTLESIFIFQGQSLLTDIVKSCFHCKRKLLKRIQTTFGPINKFSLTFASVNQNVMLDISGPYFVRAKLLAKNTRQTSNVVKVYLLHTICLTSYLNSIAIVESYGSAGFIDALHRISSKYGYPSTVFTDGSSAQLKALLGMQLTMSTSFGTIYQETGVQIFVSGVGAASHSRNGRIEKAIHIFQQFISNKKQQIETLTVLQFDSLISQSMAVLNSMPLCTKPRYKGMVSSTLITPFSFLLGRRSNIRAPASYPLLVNTREDILNSVSKVSEGMFKYFTAAIPQLLLKPALHDSKEKPLEIGDVILFPYQQSSLSTTYKLGLITNIELDSDNLSRIAEVAYCLESEQSLPTDPKDKPTIHRLCRFSRRGVHTLVKIYSASDQDINKDIDIINNRIKEINKATTTDQLDTNCALNSPETYGHYQKDLFTSHMGYVFINH